MFFSEHVTALAKNNISIRINGQITHLGLRYISCLEKLMQCVAFYLSFRMHFILKLR